jgi:hypothetical protein
MESLRRQNERMSERPECFDGSAESPMFYSPREGEVTKSGEPDKRSAAEPERAMLPQFAAAGHEQQSRQQ